MSVLLRRKGETERPKPRPRYREENALSPYKVWVLGYAKNKSPSCIYQQRYTVQGCIRYREGQGLKLWEGKVRRFKSLSKVNENNKKPYIWHICPFPQPGYACLAQKRTI